MQTAKLHSLTCLYSGDTKQFTGLVVVRIAPLVYKDPKGPTNFIFLLSKEILQNFMDFQLF